MVVVVASGGGGDPDGDAGCGTSCVGKVPSSHWSHEGQVRFGSRPSSGNDCTGMVKTMGRRLRELTTAARGSHDAGSRKLGPGFFSPSL